MRGSDHGFPPPACPEILTVWKLGGAALADPARARQPHAATMAISAVPLPNDISSGRAVYACRDEDVPMEPAGIEPDVSLEGERRRRFASRPIGWSLPGSNRM